jgi:hypothetical protein
MIPVVRIGQQRRVDVSKGGARHDFQGQRRPENEEPIVAVMAEHFLEVPLSFR